jgi:hypothetical protein
VKLSILVTFRPDLYGKLEKRLFQALYGCPRNLFVRHRASKPEMADLLCRVITVKVEDRVHLHLSLSKDL